MTCSRLPGIAAQALQKLLIGVLAVDPTGDVTTESVPTVATGAFTVLTAAQKRPYVGGLASSLRSAAWSCRQSGAAAASTAITAIGAPVVVAIRQLIAAGVLLPVARPRLCDFTARQIGIGVVLGLATTMTNLGPYPAIGRLGLALATLEFLGPLTVAIAGSRTAKEYAAAALASVGVLVLVHSSGPTD
ncbi:hypothetical protein DEI93_13570 [Curtobacterium sp. MCBD17_035]|uniref:hypothetical protein n=1 Tax=Curtobacterium sp. MCBD17_035 TaxID=2175673 RepID=UPI0011B5B73B|nr:hypothetical protein [Curtobacterium sp. MCBD17_035]WIB66974.1 hypothetical protein DEI93_13570 [Curtobacterium sp. MCBD17_035]